MLRLSPVLEHLPSTCKVLELSPTFVNKTKQTDTPNQERFLLMPVSNGGLTHALNYCLGILPNSGPPKKRHKGWSPESKSTTDGGFIQGGGNRAKHGKWLRPCPNPKVGYQWWWPASSMCAYMHTWAGRCTRGF